MPINHLVVMRTEDVARRPRHRARIVAILREGKRLAGPPPNPDPTPFGIEANRPSLELIAKYAYQQKLIPSPLPVDDMFAETRGVYRR